MQAATQQVLDRILKLDAKEPEFIQTVTSFLSSIDKLVDDMPQVLYHKVLDRMVEAERIIQFRVPWIDDTGRLMLNRGFRVQMNSSLGPYKGGLRFHPSVNLSILKFLAFEQTFKNSLTGLALGGGKGGSDFDPKGKSDGEVMRFCQSFMLELSRHIGEDTDVPAGDIGVGAREIGYLYGQYKRINNKSVGILTGKSPSYGGSFIRPEATGYGLVYLCSAMLANERKSLEGKTCLVSGSGNVALFTTEKLLALGAKVISMSDSNGVIIDSSGINEDKLKFLKVLKTLKRGRLTEYAQHYPQATYLPHDALASANPLWNVQADYAFPCATQNEINALDAQNLVRNGILLVGEGANMPTTLEAQKILMDAGVLLAPAKAANAGGVAVSGLEMAQNSQRMQWTATQVDAHLQTIMKNIYHSISEAASTYSTKNNFVDGANIASFLKISEAMLAQGYV